MSYSLSEKVSGQSDTITAAIFAFLLICACAELISKYALTWKYVNMNFWAFHPKFHAYSQEYPQNTNRNAKFRKNVSFSKT